MFLRLGKVSERFGCGQSSTMDPLKQTFRCKLAKVATDRIFRQAQRQAELFRDHAACGFQGSQG